MGKVWRYVGVVVVVEVGCRAGSRGSFRRCNAKPSMVCGNFNISAHTGEGIIGALLRLYLMLGALVRISGCRV
jgi:hypothetical protein